MKRKHPVSGSSLRENVCWCQRSGENNQTASSCWDGNSHPGCHSYESITGNWGDCVTKASSTEFQFLLQNAVGRVTLVWTKLKHGSILPCITGLGWWFWFNGVRQTFLADFGHLSPNWASFKHQSLREYCCFLCCSFLGCAQTVWCCCINMDQNLMKVFSTLLNRCHEELKPFWKQQGVQFCPS